MNYPFPADIRARIELQIRSGLFSSEDEVLRKAMGILEANQNAFREARDSVEVAEMEIAIGKVARFSLQTTKDAVRERLSSHGIDD